MDPEVGCWSQYHSMNDELEAMRVLNAASHLPALVVFDLDYTLWPFFCECRSKQAMPVLYPQAMSVIQGLKSKGVLVAIASRSPTPDIARTYLKKLDLLSKFCVLEIYSSWNYKTNHFKKIHQKTGIPYSSMLFFDDEEGNIRAVSQMGVKSVLVENGVNLDALKIGLQKFGAITLDRDGSLRNLLSEKELKTLSPPKPEPYSFANVISLANSAVCLAHSISCEESMGTLNSFGVEQGSDGQVRRQKKMTDFWGKGTKGRKSSGMEEM